MIDPTFRNINSMFVLSIKNGDSYLTRLSFLPLGEIKDFNVLIEMKPFFD